MAPRRAGEQHARWLYLRGVDRAVTIDRELLVRPAPQPTTLCNALNLLIGAAHRYRERLGPDHTIWSLIGMFAGGRLVMPAHRRLRALQGPRPPTTGHHCADHRR